MVGMNTQSSPTPDLHEILGTGRRRAHREPALDLLIAARRAADAAIAAARTVSSVPGIEVRYLDEVPQGW
jgi:hypothetical protein